MQKDVLNLNLLYLVSTRWSKPYFELALKKFFKNSNIEFQKRLIVPLSKNAADSLINNPDVIINEIFFQINGNLNRSNFKESILSKIKSEINLFNNYQWTIVTDNEMRNSELLFYSFLKINQKLPLLVLDHGLTNSQDIKFVEYILFKRLFRNFYLLYCSLFFGKKINNLLLIKRKRIYLHFKKPLLPLFKYFNIGLVHLEREIKSYCLKNNFYKPDITKKKSILILTCGSYRYKYYKFRKDSISCYKNILENKNYKEFDFIFKTKERENIESIKKDLIMYKSKIKIFDDKHSIGEIIKNNNVHFAYTSHQSSTFASLNLIKLKTFGYFVNIPSNLTKGSIFLNFYKPYKIFRFKTINNFKYMILDYDKLYHIYSKSLK